MIFSFFVRGTSDVKSPCWVQIYPKGLRFVNRKY